MANGTSEWPPGQPPAEGEGFYEGKGPPPHTNNPFINYRHPLQQAYGGPGLYGPTHHPHMGGYPHARYPHPPIPPHGIGGPQGGPPGNVEGPPPHPGKHEGKPTTWMPPVPEGNAQNNSHPGPPPHPPLQVHNSGNNNSNESVSSSSKDDSSKDSEGSEKAKGTALPPENSPKPPLKPQQMRENINSNNTLSSSSNPPPRSPMDRGTPPPPQQGPNAPQGPYPPAMAPPSSAPPNVVPSSAAYHIGKMPPSSSSPSMQPYGAGPPPPNASYPYPPRPGHYGAFSYRPNAGPPYGPYPYSPGGPPGAGAPPWNSPGGKPPPVALPPRPAAHYPSRSPHPPMKPYPTSSGPPPGSYNGPPTYNGPPPPVSSSSGPPPGSSPSYPGNYMSPHAPGGGNHPSYPGMGPPNNGGGPPPPNNSTNNGPNNSNSHATSPAPLRNEDKGPANSGGQAPPVTSPVANSAGSDGIPVHDETSQQSTLSQSSDRSDGGRQTPKGPHNFMNVSGGFPPPPGSPRSGAPSPGAASMGSASHEYPRDMVSPGWQRTAASPVSAPTSRGSDSLTRLFELDDDPGRRPWLERLLAFMEEKGTPITQCPTISKNPLDLYKLYLFTRDRGGFLECNRNKSWKDIASQLGIAASSSGAYTLKKHYGKNLLPFECYFDRGGVDPGPILAQVEASGKKKGKNASAAASNPSQPPPVPSPGSQDSRDSYSGNNSTEGYPGYPGGNGPNSYSGYPPNVSSDRPPSHPGLGPGGYPPQGPPNSGYGGYPPPRHSGPEYPHSGGYPPSGYPPPPRPGWPPQGAYLGGHPNGSAGPPPSGTPPSSSASNNVSSGSDSYARGPYAPPPNTYAGPRGPPYHPPPPPQNPPSAGNQNAPPPPNSQQQQGGPYNNPGGGGGYTPSPSSADNYPQPGNPPQQQKPPSGPPGPSGPPPPAQKPPHQPPPTPTSSSPAVQTSQPPEHQSGGRPVILRANQQVPSSAHLPSSSSPSPSFGPTNPPPPQKSYPSPSGSSNAPPGHFGGKSSNPPASGSPAPSANASPRGAPPPGGGYPPYGGQRPPMYPGGQPPPPPPGWQNRYPGPPYNSSDRSNWSNPNGGPPSRGPGPWGPERPPMAAGGGGYVYNNQPNGPPWNNSMMRPGMRSPYRPEMRPSAPPGNYVQSNVRHGFPGGRGRELLFPPGSVESTVPLLLKRRKYNKTDVQPVDGWRLVMTLKSGLLMESTWALDVLNILLYDDNAFTYFGLSNMPGLLEALLEHWRSSLLSMFGGDISDDLELEDPTSRQQVRKRGHQVSIDYLSSERTPVEELSPSEMGKAPFIDAGDTTQVLTGFNYTKRPRFEDGEFSIEREDDALFVTDEERSWDLSEKSSCDVNGSEHWRNGGGNTSKHIITHYASGDLNLLPFVKVLKDLRPEKKNPPPSVKEEKKEEEKTSAKKDSASPTTLNGENSDIEDEEDIIERIKRVTGIVFRDPASARSRWTAVSLEEENYMRDEPSLSLTSDSQDSIGKRCLCISTILRNLSFLPGNEYELSKNATFLTICGRLLLLYHWHPPRTLKQRNYDRGEEDDAGESCTSLNGDGEWWWDYLHVIRENVMVALANIAGALELRHFDEAIVRPLLDGLLEWAVSSSAYAQDPFPHVGPHSPISPQRLAIEALCKLSLQEDNVDFILSTPPYSRITTLCRLLAKKLYRYEDQVLREFSINLLYYLSGANSGIARTIATADTTIGLLLGFIEQAEQNALVVAQQHGVNALRDNPDSMGTSLDMLRRAASTLSNLSQHPDNIPLFLRQEQRLLSLVMSQILDQGVEAILSNVLYNIGKGDERQK